MKKRIILGLIVALGALLAIAYYISGIKAEQALKDSIAATNVVLAKQKNALPFKIQLSLKDTKKGLFSSTAMVDVKATMMLPTMPKDKKVPGGMPPMQMPTLSYTIPIETYHGPYLWDMHQWGIASSHMVLSLPPKLLPLLQQLLELPQTMPHINIHLVTHFNASTDVRIKIPAFHLAVKGEDMTLDWQGFDTNVNIQPKSKTLTGQLSLKPLLVNQGNNQIEVAKSHMQYQLVQFSPAITTGMVEFEIPNIMVRLMAKTLFQLRGFEMHTNTAIERGGLNHDTRIQLKSLVLDDIVYGPGQLRMRLDGLNIKALELLQQQVKTLKASQRAYDKETEAQLLMMTLNVFKKPARFMIDTLEMQFPEGPVQLSSELALDDNSMPINDVPSLMQQVHFKARITAPQALVKKSLTALLFEHMKTQAQKEATQESKQDIAEPTVSQAQKQVNAHLDDLVQAGFVQQKMNSLHVNLHFKAGVLFINDKPFKGKLF